MMPRRMSSAKISNMPVSSNGIELVTPTVPMMAWSLALPSFQPAMIPNTVPRMTRARVIKVAATKVFRAP